MAVSQKWKQGDQFQKVQLRNNGGLDCLVVQILLVFGKQHLKEMGWGGVDIFDPASDFKIRTAFF